MIKFSIIIPIYNRPDELEELLASLLVQEPIFEVVVVEDGSQRRSDGVVARYSDKLRINYIYQENRGPAGARNRGAQCAQGEWLLILDSDTTLPPDYIASARLGVEQGGVELFGGADREDSSYTAIQRAINYSMTSPMSSGGIRGAKRSMDKFYPRSFNMGVKREVFNAVGGFGDMRFGEDIDFSYRVIGAGWRSAYMPDLWLYHKRRANLRQFFKQIYNSGIARVVLSVKYPGSLKLVHTLPAMFAVGVCSLIALIPMYILIPITSLLLLPFGVLIVAILIDASLRCSSVKVGALAVVTTFTQLLSYGLGFLSALWSVVLLKGQGKGAFTKNFYD